MEPTKFITKSGEEITIRLATADDASALLAMKLDYLENTKTIPLFQSEYSNDIKKEEDLIRRIEEEKNSVLFVAENNTQLVGNIDLNGNQRLKLFHTGVIGMGIREEWRGQGVGSALLDVVIRWSKSNPYINLLWLEVYASNDAGIALYQKMGFHESGRIKNFFHEDNELIDKITMTSALSTLEWGITFEYILNQYKAKNAGIAVAMASIFNEVMAQKIPNERINLGLTEH